MIHDFLSFYTVVSKCEEWKEEAFVWSASGDSQHRYATAVEHAVGCYLAGSKCKPNSCQKMSIAPIGLNIFSLRQQGNPGKILKSCFGMSEHFWMDETNYNFAFQISK